MVVASVKDSVEARPTDRPTPPPKGEERDAFQSEIVVQRRLVAPICIMQNNVCENETRRREGGREGRVSSSVGVVAVPCLPGVMNRMENF